MLLMRVFWLGTDDALCDGKVFFNVESFILPLVIKIVVMCVCVSTFINVEKPRNPNLKMPGRTNLMSFTAGLLAAFCFAAVAAVDPGTVVMASFIYGTHLSSTHARSNLDLGLTSFS